MKTDTEIRTAGLRLLVKELGSVDAERFISLILREPFDYTKWQRELFAENTVGEISAEAMQQRRSSEP
jgi:hypothetical protein